MRKKLPVGKVYMNGFIPKELDLIIRERAKKNHRTISGEFIYLMEIALKTEEKSE